jgi:hypothetical protein
MSFLIQITACLLISDSKITNDHIDKFTLGVGATLLVSLLIHDCAITMTKIICEYKYKNQIQN